MNLLWANTRPLDTPKKKMGIYSDDEEYDEVFYPDNNTNDILNESNTSIIDLYEEAEHRYYDSINNIIENSFNFIYNIPRSTKILLIVLLFQDRIYDRLYNYDSNQ